MATISDFWGIVIGDFDEWGYFSLNELLSIDVHGLTVERDLYFTRGYFRDVWDAFRKERGEYAYGLLFF